MFARKSLNVHFEWDRSDGGSKIEKADIFYGQPVGEISSVGQGGRETNDSNLVV